MLAEQKLMQSEREIEAYEILPINASVAAEFERLLSNKGLRRLGRGDLLIAATTLANRATLVTRNLKDFRKVPGLLLENWAD